MNIHEATSSYEKWKASFLPLVPADLRRKHRLMRHSVFEFFRATFYRWMQVWPEVCGELNKAPRVLAIGDSHIENFGTWRDAEGRLIWGCNDFDEAHTLPYTLDLVRLATSAHLASDANHLSIRRRDASDLIIDGYKDALSSGGQPFVLGEHHVWLRDIALNRLRDPVHFWARMEAQQRWKGPVPTEVRRGLDTLLREPGRPCEIKRRVAGIGSLGHRRVVFIVNHNGGRVAREAKELGPSACVWASREAAGLLRYAEIVDRAVRVRDPFLHVEGQWVFRRLASDCSRIELAMLPAKRDEERLLYATGWETANIHLGSHAAIRAVLRDLNKRPARWLHRASNAMSAAARRDWKRYRS
jgi:uncharacterized protein (DUF2252 family)